jgi:hypothetical protein
MAFATLSHRPDIIRTAPINANLKNTFMVISQNLI